MGQAGKGGRRDGAKDGWNSAREVALLEPGRAGWEGRSGPR